MQQLSEGAVSVKTFRHTKFMLVRGSEDQGPVVKISLEDAIQFFPHFQSSFLVDRKHKMLFTHSLADSYIQRLELLTLMSDEFHIICFCSNTGPSIFALKRK